LIGDRALDEAQRNPDLVKMDLGQEWQKLTGLPMVFGVFAAPSSAPVDKLKQAHNDLLSNAINFRDNQQVKDEVIRATATRSGFSIERINGYFNEVTNILSPDSVTGLELFLTEVCGLETDIEWLEV
jgi:predicted solute-binding protein